jgi:hypothetical protein
MESLLALHSKVMAMPTIIVGVLVNCPLIRAYISSIYILLRLSEISNSPAGYFSLNSEILY